MLDEDSSENEEPPRVPALDREEDMPVDADFCLSMAQIEHSSGNLTQALEFYVDYLNALPSPQHMRLMELDALTDMVLAIGQILEDRVECVVKCYTQILNLLPNNAKVLNALGVYLCSKGELRAAKTYLSRAAEAGFVAAEKSLLHVLWEIIPRWHFRMLNDLDRNQAYKTAIESALNEGHRDVVDIGTGCGLLTAFVIKHCPEARVTAFEEKQTLVKIASQIFNQCKSDHNVNLIHSNSNVAKCDKPFATLLMTEIFDSGFFGENCIETIHHSIQTHLAPGQKCKIIPAAATIYVTGISCPKLAAKHRFLQRYPHILNLVDLIDEDSEPYDCEYLQRESVDYLTDTQPFLNVDFYNFDQVTAMKEKRFLINSVDLNCKQNGTIDALVVWFDLYLDENTNFSTKPKAEKTCWEQAVFYIDPIKITQNQIITIQPKLEDPSCLSFEMLNAKSDRTDYLPVSKEIVTFLNDHSFVECIKKFADTFHNCKGLKVIDFNHFPLFGLFLAKKGATVYHIYRNKCDAKVIRNIMRINQINANCLRIIEEDCVDWKEFQKADVVLANFIDTDGSWNGTELGIDAAIYPKRISLKLLLIQSEYLEFCNKVNEENVFGCGIAKHINEYSGWEHTDMDVSTFHHKKLSEIRTLDIRNLEEQNFEVHMRTISDGNINGILYWYELGFTESIVFDTYDSKHFNKTCTFLQTPQNVQINEEVTVNIVREGNYMRIDLIQRNCHY